MLVEVVSDHFCLFLIVIESFYLFHVVFCFRLFCVVLMSFLFSDVAFGCSALF